ncbi:carbon-nitrogen hydrolase [Cubamyces sp. BRFM 1775]|nr:carbon-nitrogen hydrolase [Cubamyces sp. BRFM 1775]
MRVAVVQFAPKIGHVQENIRRAQALCERLRPNSVDLVCLPEMIFTGYVFPDAASISPYLEEPRTGPTSRFCSELAARLHCYVVAGYPERLLPDEIERVKLEDGREVERVGANAAALYGPDGAFVGEYRKTNLYETDMTWAKPGTGFTTFPLPPPLGPLTLAICMDLNTQPPAAWTSLRTGPYELAAYCAAQRTRVLVLVNAWLDSGDGGREDEPDWRTLDYWALRLRPLWARVVKEGEEVEEDGEDEDGDDGMSGGEEDVERPQTVEEGREPDEELVVVVCNRAGTENGITFAGSSSLFSLRPNSGKPRLLHAMKRQQEGVEVWEYPNAVSANDGNADGEQHGHNGS